jgi:hypothetical protein
MDRIMSYDNSLSRQDNLSLFYCFMILFECTNIIIIYLIIFYLN